MFGPSLPRGEGSGPTGPLRISGAASRLGVVVRRPPRYDHARAAADFPSQGDRGRAASTPSNGSLAFTRRRAVRVWGLLLGVPACLPAASLRGGMLAIGRATWPSGASTQVVECHSRARMPKTSLCGRRPPGCRTVQGLLGHLVDHRVWRSGEGKMCSEGRTRQLATYVFGTRTDQRMASLGE